MINGMVQMIQLALTVAHNIATRWSVNSLLCLGIRNWKLQHIIFVLSPHEHKKTDIFYTYSEHHNIGIKRCLHGWL